MHGNATARVLTDMTVAGSAASSNCSRLPQLLNELQDSIVCIVFKLDTFDDHLI